jgi:hypothetical protein
VEYLYEHGMIAITNPDELEQGKPARYRNLHEDKIVFADLEKKIGTYTGTQISI